ncbi:MAG TPA: FAD-dependent oxidoreductase, partial [Thermoproteota archaeon]|nr:FAD-dependent oxidoreductase [Thermoproteota archaeon]
AIKKEGGHVVGVSTKDGALIPAKNVLLAPGRRGASWLAGQCSALEIPVSRNPVDLGVRVELPADVIGPLTDDLYEPKLRFMSKSFDDPVRTFCVNPRGQVITEYYDDVVTVNGHSMKDGKTANTNLALLVNNYFTEPFKDPISYGKYIARLANLISNGIVIQRLWDLLHGRRSTPERLSQSATVPTLMDATPGDLSFILPHRIMTDIIEMLRALDKLAPGIISMNTLLYGVEAKFYSSRVGTDANLQTPVTGLYVAGDGAGLTRGLSQSAASGLHVAEGILGSREITKPA